jgi:hypothetical protein
MKLTTLFFAVLFLSQSVFSQKKDSPYEWKWKRDGIWLGAVVAGNAAGISFINSKEPFTVAEVNTKMTQINDINFLDRWVAGNNSESASSLSDIPFGVSFVAPLTLLFDDQINNHTGQFLGMYFESLATTSALFTMTAGLVTRARPYVYSETKSIDQKTEVTATRSFYSGHVAATATATFFAAKVFQDYNPNSKAIPYVYAGAAIVPAAVGYLRMEAGQHFLTDVLLGYGLGAVVGYYTPELHKKGNESYSFKPVMGQNFYGETYQALSLSYNF